MTDDPELTSFLKNEVLATEIRDATTRNSTTELLEL